MTFMPFKLDVIFKARYMNVNVNDGIICTPSLGS